VVVEKGKLERLLGSGVILILLATAFGYFIASKTISSKISIPAIEHKYGRALDDVLTTLDIENELARSEEYTRFQELFSSMPAILNVYLRDPELETLRPWPLFSYGRLPVEEGQGRTCPRGRSASNRERGRLRRCVNTYVTLPTRQTLEYDRHIHHQDEFLHLYVMFDYDRLLEELD